MYAVVIVRKMTGSGIFGNIMSIREQADGFFYESF